eukprot:Hpha_TRINITY_DN32110_c0_g1::TRINITY_DN32110_c0_g1_i1::g.18469::m.18469
MIPVRLRVNVPSAAAECAGTYELQEETVHGQPLWCRLGHKRKRWLFSTHAGWWMLADTRLAFKEESCAGLLCTCAQHDGRMPHQVEGWQYGDGWGWRTDPEISVALVHCRAFSPPPLSEPP